MQFFSFLVDKMPGGFYICSAWFNLLTRCTCTQDTCHWENGCGEYWYQKDDGTYATNGFCQCWTATENVTFTFIYKTKDLSVVENYGGHGYQLQNIAELFYIPDGAVGGASVSSLIIYN